LSIIIYNLKTSEKIRVTTKKYYNDEFSIEKLYQNYIDSCYMDNSLVSHIYDNGYHYISKNIEGVENKENRLCKEYDLPRYNENSIRDKEYRDVRNFKYEEMIQRVGMRSNYEPYKLRRLRFESKIYCLLRQHSEPKEESFRYVWNSLGKTKDYIKYGKGIKLIIKSYWLDDYKPITKKSWSRV
jgi:hypothetical protein